MSFAAPHAANGTTSDDATVELLTLDEGTISLARRCAVRRTS